ncbi:MAG: hypothetical protein AAGU01_03210, partial [Clostridiaceae bacterium]
LHEEALNCYSKAIEIDNRKSDAYISKALVYMDLKDYERAFPLAKKAYNLNPEDEWSRCYYFIIKDMLKNTKCKSDKGIVIPFKVENLS